jgi:hypothetical protein
VSNADELLYGSDPSDPTSTPEHKAWLTNGEYTSCFDGIDNHKDGKTDLEDPDCDIIL